MNLTTTITPFIATNKIISFTEIFTIHISALFVSILVFNKIYNVNSSFYVNLYAIFYLKNSSICCTVSTILLKNNTINTNFCFNM